jgi:hypothetical protein
MPELTPQRERLDSWKAIAHHLQRDVATVRRWEKALLLPVHRVAGRGRSVFAYTSEIDAWLKTAQPLAPERPRRAWLWAAAGLALVLIAAGVAGLARGGGSLVMRVEATDAGLIARDRNDLELWRHMFPATRRTYLVGDPVQVVAGEHPGVFLATSHHSLRTEDRVEGGAVTFFDSLGVMQQTFTFDDRVTFGGKTFGPPWGVTAFAIHEADGGRRVAVAAHHYTWDPGLVTILDDRWQRLATFTHAGWIEQVRWLDADRLVIGGFSNAHDGGMIALLDAADLDGQGPEAPGSAHYCDDCSAKGPLRMLILPRSELNIATASRFNRVTLQMVGDRLVARSIEVPQAAKGDADAIFELSPTLEIVSASFGERYWELHRALEMSGVLDHPRQRCADRDGPRAVKRWDPDGGWRSLRLR